MMEDLLIVSLSVSVIILLLFMLSFRLDKRYSARFWYFVWLIVALRLVLPFRPELPRVPVVIEAPSYDMAVALNTTGEGDVSAPEGDRETEDTPETVYSPLLIGYVLKVLWAITATVLFLWYLLDYWRFLFSVRKKRKRCAVSCKVSVYRMNGLTSPVTAGFFRPFILLPETDYDEAELAVILKHELTHIRRGDIWYKLLLSAVKALHFFNPVIYFMVRRAVRDLEYSCDEAVIRDMDSEEKKSYAKAILKSISVKV